LGESSQTLEGKSRKFGKSNIRIKLLIYEDVTSMDAENSGNDLSKTQDVTSNEVPPKSFKEEYKKDPADPGTRGGQTSLGRGGAFTSLNSFDSKAKGNGKSHPKGETPNPNGKVKSNGNTKEPPTAAQKQIRDLTETLESNLRGERAKGAGRAGGPGASGGSGNGARGGKNGKLVARESFTIDEARQLLHKKGKRGAVSLVLLLPKLGIEVLYKTHVEQLEAAHGAAAKKAGNEHATWLHEAIYGLVKEGRRFDRLPEVFEAVKG
jgi:hypothetical protein